MIAKSKILVVDDKEENLLAMKQTLNEVDAEVITVTNGQEALKITLHHDFALIILDVQMPEMDGYELAELLRGKKETQRIPIIFLSAVYSSSYSFIKGYKSGAVDFLTKPIEPQIIVNKAKVFVEMDQQKKEGEEFLITQQILIDQLSHTKIELEEQNESLMTVMDSIDAFVYIADMQTYEILFLNEYGRRILGDTKGQLCWKALHKDQDGPCAFCTNDRLLTKESTPAGIYQWEHQNTVTARWYDCRDQAIPWPDGRLVRMEIATDITERRLNEAKLRQIEKAESLTRMAGAVAHNFNNQLFVVMGNLEMALEELPTDALQRQNLTEALQAARRSAETSGLMLTYVGQGTHKSEPVDLSDACRRILPSLQRVIADGIALETDFMDTCPIARTSSGQMQQVITHLITNAVEAIGDSGGKIVLATRTMPKDDISESHLAPPDWKPTADNYACLEVTDSGCGIVNEDIDKIFDPFFSTKFTGRGLGLAVILGIVRQGRGAISAESREGHGSIFRVFYPLINDVVSLVTQKDTAVQPMHEGNSVLLVDDDDSVRNMAGTMLKRLSHSVIAASEGADALDLFNRHRDEIGCVITDLTMPGMNGWETIAALRQIDPNIPIILASGYDEAEVMGGGQSERPQVFLHKPFTKADLKAALSAVGKGAGKLE